MDWYWYLAIIFASGLCTYLLVPPSIKLARRIGAIDEPDGRRVNTSAIPRLGGIAIYVGIMLSTIAFGIADRLTGNMLQTGSLGGGISYPGVLLALTMVFALGLLDDLFDLNALVKLAGQIVAACVVAASGLLVTHFGSPFFNFEVELGLAAYPVTVFYLVAFANIINLIDGLDGLAAGIVTISAVTLLVLSLEKGGMDAVVLALAAIGACLAFLRFNFHPAKTYMGDGGALLLGMTLGVISLMGIVRTPALISILVPVAIAFIPVIDTFSAIVRRIRLRQPIMKADVAHIHHRFMRAGFNQRSTVLIIYGVDALLALCAWLIVGVTGVWRIALSVFLAALALLLVWILGLHESVLQHFYYKRPAHRPPSGDDGDGDAGAETAIERGREIGSAD